MKCPKITFVFGEWVCPECEYHGNKDPEKGTYR